jgi:hypothetical protein
MPKSKPNSRAEHSFLTSGANRDDQTRGVEGPLVTERVDSATQASHACHRHQGRCHPHLLCLVYHTTSNLKPHLNRAYQYP